MLCPEQCRGQAPPVPLGDIGLWRGRRACLILSISLFPYRPVGLPDFQGTPMLNIEHATMLVGQSSLSMEAIASILDNTEFKVIARACSVDRLAPGDLQRHKTILIILDNGYGVKNALQQIKAFRQLHADPRIAVLTRAPRVADVAMLLHAGANACFEQGIPPAIFLKSLELVMLGETFLPAAKFSLPRKKAEVRSPYVDGPCLQEN
jgi:hypothetical protein